MTATTATPVRAATDALTRLRHLQWGVRATLTLGVAASVAANILHARPNPISQGIAAWPPLALLLTVELIVRVPVHRRPLAALRLLATGSIAAIAAYASYFHMAAVVSRYGEHQPNPYLLPISVDGLIVAASISLVEISGRIRAHTSNTEPPTNDTPGAGTPRPAEVAATTTDARDESHSHRPTVVAGGASLTPQYQPPQSPRRTEVETAPDPDKYLDRDRTGDEAPAPLSDQSPPPHIADAEAPGRDSADDETTGPDHHTVPADTAAAVAYWYQRDPNLHPAEIASRIGRSERTVRRHWPPADRPLTDPTNGHYATQLAESLRGT
jgi:hypothetical protein